MTTAVTKRPNPTPIPISRTRATKGLAKSTLPVTTKSINTMVITMENASVPDDSTSSRCETRVSIFAPASVGITLPPTIAPAINHDKGAYGF